jgi:hypothetical protein
MVVGTLAQRFAIIVVALNLSLNAVHASTAGAGNITGILAHQQGLLFFNQHGARTAAPACVTMDRWVVDTSTISGQSLAATLISAWSLGRKVIVQGAGGCTKWGDTETVDYVQIAD